MAKEQFIRLIPHKPTPDPDQAAARGEVLWALELDEGRRPAVAHRITAFERNGQGVILAARTVCGERFLEGECGCWQLPVGKMPLQDPHVHCGGQPGD